MASVPASIGVGAVGKLMLLHDEYNSVFNVGSSGMVVAAAAGSETGGFSLNSD